MPVSGHAEPSATIAVTITFTVLAVITAGLRVFSRLQLARRPGWDDTFIVIATALNVGITIIVGLQVKYGMGRHFDTLSTAEKMMQGKTLLASIVVYSAAVGFAKISILLQYLRIFPDRRLRAICYGTIALLVPWTLIVIFSSIFLCSPISRFWNPEKPGHCMNQSALWFSGAGINAFSDILVAVLPIPFLARLELPNRQKRALVAVFALAAFTCIVCVLRPVALAAAATNTDTSWHAPLASIWSSVEVSTGIICACLPTLRVLLSQLFSKSFNSSGFKRSTGGDQISSGGRQLSHGVAAVYDRDGLAKANHTKSKSGPTIQHEIPLEDAKFGRTFDGRGVPHHNVTIARGTPQRKDSDSDRSSEIEFDTVRGEEARTGSQADAERGIQVVTVVRQEVESEWDGSPGRSRESDDESLQGLVPSAAKHKRSW